jgi:hypothetical protein
VLAVAACLLLVGVQAWTVAERNRHQRAAGEVGAQVVLTVGSGRAQTLLDAVRAADPTGRYAMAAVSVTATSKGPPVLAVDSPRADRILSWGGPDTVPVGMVPAALRPILPDPVTLRPGTVTVTADLQDVRSQSPLRLSLSIDSTSSQLRLDLGQMRPGAHAYSGEVPKTCAVSKCRLGALAVSHPWTDLGAATATFVVRSLRATEKGQASRALPSGFDLPGTWRAGAPTVGGPTVRIETGRGLRVRVEAPGGPYAEVVHGHSPEPLPAIVASRGSSSARGRVGEAVGLAGVPVRYRVERSVAYAPRLGRSAALVDLELALRQFPAADLGDRQVWLARDDAGREARLARKLRGSGIAIVQRESLRALERVYAGDGAVLALRLLLVSGGAAVVVSVGALFVAAYVGRRQRAYEVAALRSVGIRRRTVRALLVRENLATVLVALVSGALAAVVASWAVLPALPQFDSPPVAVPVRYAPEVTWGWVMLFGLGALLGTVALLVAAVQLRAGRYDRLREGVR